MDQKEFCAFCGLDDSIGPMTTEHFAPKGLWVGPRPQLTRTVPVHDACNKAGARDAEYLRDFLVLEQGAAGHPMVQKHQATMRSKIDSGRLTKTLSGLHMRPVMSSGRIYLGHAPAFPVDQARIMRALQNVMKGIYYSVNRKPLPQNCEFKITAAQGDNLLVFRPIIDAMVPWQGFGDDVFACRYIFPLSVPGSMACLIMFYRHRIFYGWACPKGLLEAAEKHAAATIMASRAVFPVSAVAVP